MQNCTGIYFVLWHVRGTKLGSRVNAELYADGELFPDQFTIHAAPLVSLGGEVLIESDFYTDVTFRVTRDQLNMVGGSVNTHHMSPDVF